MTAIKIIPIGPSTHVVHHAFDDRQCTFVGSDFVEMVRWALS